MRRLETASTPASNFTQLDPSLAVPASLTDPSKVLLTFRYTGTGHKRLQMGMTSNEHFYIILLMSWDVIVNYYFSLSSLYSLVLLIITYLSSCQALCPFCVHVSKRSKKWTQTDTKVCLFCLSVVETN